MPKSSVAGPLSILDALGGGVEGAGQGDAQAVAHDRAVAVVAEAALDEGVLRAAQRVGLDHARDVAERVIEAARRLVSQHLRRDPDRLGMSTRGFSVPLATRSAEADSRGSAPSPCTLISSSAMAPGGVGSCATAVKGQAQANEAVARSGQRKRGIENARGTDTGSRS